MLEDRVVVITLVLDRDREDSPFHDIGEQAGIDDQGGGPAVEDGLAFEQDLFRLYREGVITLDEALANADSPTNLSWLINNSEITSSSQNESLRIEAPLDFSETDDNGTSFKEFTLSLNDADDDANHGQ